MKLHKCCSYMMKNYKHHILYRRNDENAYINIYDSIKQFISIDRLIEHLYFVIANKAYGNSDTYLWFYKTILYSKGAYIDDTLN